MMVIQDTKINATRVRWPPTREGGTATGEKTTTKVRCRHRDGGGDGARHENVVRTGKKLGHTHVEWKGMYSSCEPHTGSCCG